MKTEKTTGLLLIAGAIGVFVPYTVLTQIFEYPVILRQGAGTILTKFHAGGSRLIFTWWAFAMFGVLLLAAYVYMGRLFANRLGFIKWATTLGVISGIAQIIGLLRWVFVVPVLANHYVTTGSGGDKDAIVVAFETVHQFGGVLLGEHIGQLFTIIWTLLFSYAFIRLRYLPKWIGWLGIVASVIYLAAQAELFATVIPGFPVWDMAAFVGSTLWLLWLIAVGVCFVRKG